MADMAQVRNKNMMSDKENPVHNSRNRHPVRNAVLTVICIMIAAIVLAGFLCGIRKVYVEGNSLYTKQEVAEFVIPTEYSDSIEYKIRHNVFFLSFFSLLPASNRIPFVNKVTVRPTGYDSVKITVDEKQLDGYIPYANRNLYFDSDGIVQEISSLTVTGVTYVSGLDVSEASVGEKIAAEDETRLDRLLDAVQTLQKYDLSADSILIAENNSIALFFDRIEVDIGRSGYELKISKISQIMPYLEGRSGVIDLTNYNSSDENIILK